MAECSRSHCYQSWGFAFQREEGEALWAGGLQSPNARAGLLWDAGSHCLGAVEAGGGCLYRQCAQHGQQHVRAVKAT